MLYWINTCHIGLRHVVGLSVQVSVFSSFFTSFGIAFFSIEFLTSID